MLYLGERDCGLAVGRAVKDSVNGDEILLVVERRHMELGLRLAESMRYALKQAGKWVPVKVRPMPLVAD